ncbi:SLBB domain [Streptococcus pneumoniae]|nr:SLBB domain [Streptococcus pneumoniae]
MNQPKETPKQEQKVDPNKEEKTIPTPAVPKPEPPKPDPVPVPKPQAKQVTISVKGNNGYIMGAKKMDVQDGDTVYKVLQRTGLDVDASGSRDSIYVKGINDLYEKDIADTSGWKYRVNGAFPNHSAGVATVKPGDTIEWVYVLQ